MLLEVTMKQVGLRKSTWCSSFALFTLFLSGCASNAAVVDPPTEPTLNLLGVVSLEVFELGVVASGTFVKTPQPLEVQAGNPYSALNDQCFVTTAGEAAPALPGETPVGSRPLDAGATVLIENGTLAYLTLEKDPSSETVSYTASTEEALPTTPLSLEIPGQEFPAFTDIKFESIPAFELSEPLGEAVTPDTTFRWTGSSDNGVISLQITQFEPDLSVSCFAKDDGEFTFPDATKTELETLQLTAGELRLPTRVAARYDVRDDAVLLLVTKQQGAR
jgi:hypothetical protein